VSEFPQPAYSPDAEAQRLAALASYEIMDTLPEAQFDDLVRIAAQICDVPMALISLVDEQRQWFKANLGLDARETSREIAFCDHAIEQDELFVVEDASRDARFANNPLVIHDPKLRFYAGAPLKTPDGHRLGTLCVLDRQPGELTPDQANALRALARQVMAQLELRKALARERSSERRHRQILESAVDYGIISMDLTGRVTSWNEGARRIFGWTEVEMCGRPCDDFFTAEDCAASVPEKEMGQALAHGRGSDERWHLRKDGTTFWASGEMMPLTTDSGEPVGFLKILRDRTDFRHAQERLKASEEAADRDRRLLTGELEHRVKNTLAIVQAIVHQSLRTAATFDDARLSIEDRLVSLGRAHDILTKGQWAAAPVGAIVASATSMLGVGPERIRSTGPAINISARAAVGLAMAVHELSTNAVKFGALSNETGHVEIEWETLGEGAHASFRFSWREVGGPRVQAPSRKGFGSRLIQASLSGQPEGANQISYHDSGVEWISVSPLRMIEEISPT
jgi:PAS domain S-box-containing protein